MRSYEDRFKDEFKSHGECLEAKLNLVDEMRSFTAWIVVAMCIALIGLVMVATAAPAAEHHHHQPGYESQMHEEFYRGWNMPQYRDSEGNRYRSCCSLQDCFPTAIRQLPDGSYEARRRAGSNLRPVERDGPSLSEWVRFPASLLEQNQPDMKDSPDSLSHACISNYSDMVYCATLGSGM